MRALAIMYHDVVEGGDFASSGFPGEGASLYKLRREDFQHHLEAIRDAVPGDRVSSIAAKREWPEPAPVFLTFDDGGASALHPTADLLESFGWRGHFFVTTERIDTAGFLDADSVRELHRRGHVIGSHSASHPTRMAALTRAQIDREWRESLKRLSAITGANLITASVPGGYYSRDVAESAARAGIEVLFTSEPTAGTAFVDGCLVLGRYAVQRGMGPEWSAGLAAGRRIPRWRQSSLWKAKQMAKFLGGEAYLKLRRAILERP
ncbi:MAG TPA: polysaccharide deacetylase family protein [Candidatus Acidoferrales bacterium]|nr:polysaccharide deacetylase family protein [Candidatus Acidoferrales bacterium]